MARKKKAEPLRPFQLRERNLRQIVTPEGVSLTVELADIGERSVAFIIDVVFWNLAVFLIVFPISFLRVFNLSIEIVTGLILFVGFLVRNLYFLHFELALRGATPGKRIVGLRVIDRRGGPLLASAVIARNLTREFEIFMPLIVLVSLGGVDSQGWAQWLAFVWILAIGAIPFINRDRMRGGDLIAGTIVVSLPRQALLGDLAQNAFQFSFEDRQLRAYGNYELQVLEEVLRNAGKASYSPDTLRQVGEKIRHKIGWREQVAPENEERFLRDFYTAQRAFLEREQLFGKVRLDKHHPAAPQG